MQSVSNAEKLTTADSHKITDVEDLLNDLKEDDYEPVASYWGINYLVAQWIEPSTTTTRLNVAVLMPSGTNESSFKVSVHPHGRTLEISVNLPKPFLEMNLLHRRFLTNPTEFKINEIALAINGFERALKTRREHKDSTIANNCQILLPFKVSTDFSYHFLGWNDNNTLVVYVKLHSPKESYGQGENSQPIELS